MLPVIRKLGDFGDKGNNKITEQSSKGKGKTHKSTDKISQQPENWKNRKSPDFVQAFPNK